MNKPNDDIVLRATGVAKVYEEGDLRTGVLSNVNFALRRGETMSIVGASGSGKSTLLHIIGGLDTLSAGKVEVNGRVLSDLSDAERGRERNRSLGFIYQFHHLLQEFSALENVAMPLLVRREPKAEAEKRARAVLERVGLGERLIHRPHELSGGERQRAAVARALVTNPRIVLADEPTGNLDGGNAESVFALMLELNREFSTSLIVVTHDRQLAGRMDRVLELDRGNLLERA
jgi:lipoprotein-releasing system ATP-binding protein